MHMHIFLWIYLETGPFRQSDPIIIVFQICKPSDNTHGDDVVFNQAATVQMNPKYLPIKLGTNK